jgi:hypothetical protein
MPQSRKVGTARRVPTCREWFLPERSPRRGDHTLPRPTVTDALPARPAFAAGSRKRSSRLFSLSPGEARVRASQTLLRGNDVETAGNFRFLILILILILIFPNEPSPRRCANLSVVALAMMEAWRRRTREARVRAFQPSLRGNDVETAGSLRFLILILILILIYPNEPSPSGRGQGEGLPSLIAVT